MAALWQRYLAWFTARLPRERLIVALAAVGGIVFLGYSYAIEPALLRSAKAQREAAGMPVVTATLRQQAKQLLASAKDPDAPLRAELALAETEFAKQSERFHEVERSLIPPAEMSTLLETMLKRSRGLELVSLRSLPPVSLLPDTSKTGDKPAAAPAPVATAAGIPVTAEPVTSASGASAGSGGQLYKHGIELKIAGNYLDLTAYVQALELAAPILLWGRLDLVTERYPRSVMTLTVHTLSMDTSWLAL